MTASCNSISNLRSVLFSWDYFFIRKYNLRLFGCNLCPLYYYITCKEKKKSTVSSKNIGTAMPIPLLLQQFKDIWDWNINETINENFRFRFLIFTSRWVYILEHGTICLKAPLAPVVKSIGPHDWQVFLVLQVCPIILKLKNSELLLLVWVLGFTCEDKKKANINQHKNLRAIYRRKESHLKAEKRWKIDHRYCTSIGPNKYLFQKTKKPLL